MSKVAIPCSKGKAIVCADGKLPCPFLATCTALKMIEKNKDTTADWDPRVGKEINMVFEMGIQVEWMEFDGFMGYMNYCG